jgi:integrase/recombinase XerD
MRHLRHGFACNAGTPQGVDVQTKLPHLATYLGHVSVASTYYYLQLTPELRQSASQRFHQHFGSLITLDEGVV